MPPSFYFIRLLPNYNGAVKEPLRGILKPYAKYNNLSAMPKLKILKARAAAIKVILLYAILVSIYNWPKLLRII